MTRLFSVLVLFLVPYLAPAQCWGQASGGRSAPQQKRDLSALERASVRISNDQGDHRIVGTGTIIAYEKDDDGTTRALVLTNHHLFPTLLGDLIVDVPLSPHPYRAKFLAVDDYADLGIIAIVGDEHDHTVIPLASQDPAKGTRIFSAGYPHGQGPSPRAGKWFGFQGHRLKSNDAPVYETDLRSDQGDSGSGISDGSELYAVLWGGDPQHGSALVGLPEIYRFLCKQDCLKTNFPRLWALLHRGKPGTNQPGVPVVQRPTQPDAIPAPTDAPKKMPAPDKPPVEVKTVPGQAGLPGKDGRDGKDGAPGKAGENGRDANPAEIDALIAAVADLKKEIILLKQQPAQTPPVVRTRIVPALTK